MPDVSRSEELRRGGGVSRDARLPTGSTAAQGAAPGIRRATAADVPPLTRMLARAYNDDPVAIWLCASAQRRPALLEALYRARLRQLLGDREIWVAPELSSAAVWLAPGRAKVGVPRDGPLIRRLLSDPRLVARVPLLAIGLARVQLRHPREPPHWYLSLLGTDPQAQGRGLGSAVLRPVLERCDHDRAGVYLETAKERNLGFYERYGFRVTGRLRLPRGPVMWLMWREPRVEP
jgi:ribosomal protein S18 acetylase RimI-like enzyme